MTTRPIYASLRDLEAAVARYQRTWWRLDVDASQRIAAQPGLEALLSTASLVTTSQVYRDPTNDDWCPARLQLHDLLVDRCLGSGTPETDPRAYFTIGCMGVGKARVLRPLVDRHRLSTGRASASLARIAADEIREEMPEYASGLGTFVVQPEIFDITYGPLFDAALASHRDIVYDTIGRVDSVTGQVSFEPQLRELSDAGYEIHVLLGVAPLDVCVKRAEDRALNESGRIVDPHTQADQFDQPARALHRVRDLGLAHHWAIVDTSKSPDDPPLDDAGGDWASS